MKKFLNKVLIFLCATLFFLLGAGCWGEGGGNSAKHEQDGRALFATIPVGVYVDGVKNENGWKVSQDKSLYDGGNIEVSADGTLTIWHNDNPNVRIVVSLGEFVRYFTSDGGGYEFKVEGSTMYDIVYIFKTRKELDIKI